MLKLMLPLPPSTNALYCRWRNQVYRSREYIAWLREADGVAMQQQAFRHSKAIEGHYAVQIMLAEDCALDIDNPVKALLDWCQNRGLTANDRECRYLLVEKNPSVPSGWLAVTLYPVRFLVKPPVAAPVAAGVDGVG